MMTIRKVMEIVDGKVLVGEDRLDERVDTACGSDLMSDVLAFVKEKAVLITGLINPHVLRTSEMLDITCIVFSRGKIPGDEILEMADDVRRVRARERGGAKERARHLVVPGILRVARRARGDGEPCGRGLGDRGGRAGGRVLDVGDGALRRGDRVCRGDACAALQAARRRVVLRWPRLLHEVRPQVRADGRGVRDGAGAEPGDGEPHRAEQRDLRHPGRAQVACGASRASRPSWCRSWRWDFSRLRHGWR